MMRAFLTVLAETDPPQFMLVAPTGDLLFVPRDSFPATLDAAAVEIEANGGLIVIGAVVDGGGDA